MARRSSGWKKPKKKKTDPVVGIVFICAVMVIGATSIAGDGVVKTLEGAALIVLVLGLILVGGFAYILSKRIRITQRRRQAVTERGVNRMNWKEFELFVIDSLEVQGYRLIHHSSKPGDMGADVVMQLGKDKWAIQVKHYSHPVSNSAVQEAYTSMAMYGCNRSMVVTNNHFTSGAKLLAAGNNTKLFDREDIGKWLIASQK